MIKIKQKARINNMWHGKGRREHDKNIPFTFFYHCIYFRP